MIARFLRALFEIKNRDRIAPLPRVYSSDFDKFTDDERRVLARYGARDPAGIRNAMSRYKVKSVQELIARIEHYRPRRKPLHRLRRLLARFVGGYDYNPHKREIMAATRPQKSETLETLERMKQWE